MGTETEQVRSGFTLTNAAGPRVDDPVEATFGEGGYLAQKFDGYRPRPGQLSLSRAVLDAIASSDHLICEGPTGCHVAGQKLLRHDGELVSVEEVKVGDQLMGPDGKPRTVLRLARGHEAIVEVRAKGEEHADDQEEWAEE